MKKVNIIAIGIILGLAFILGIALWFNQEESETNQETLASAELNIVVDGELVGVICYEELVSLDVTEFQAVYDTSSTEAVTETYKGVELKSIFSYLGIDITDKSVVTATAVDNYAVAYGVEEVLADESIYVTFARNGEAILSSDDGDDGPFILIVKDDQFSNRRCKWLIEIGVE